MSPIPAGRRLTNNRRPGCTKSTQRLVTELYPWRPQRRSQVLETAPRRIPKQERGQRRVAAFLQAAAAVITEKGYEQATMSAIAQRSRSSIGSLYQFFPNKWAVAEALRAQYITDLEQLWAVLGRRAATLSPERLACQLVSLQVQIVTRHPALLALLDAPPTVHTPTRRELIRARIAMVLRARAPHLSKVTAARVAAVVQQITWGLLALYAQSDAEGKSAVLKEFEAVLIGYLVPKLRRTASRGDASISI